jgi:hypothetical protein
MENPGRNDGQDNQIAPVAGPVSIPVVGITVPLIIRFIYIQLPGHAPAYM